MNPYSGKFSLDRDNGLKFNESDVLTKIKGLNTQKAVGPDNIPPLLIKRCGFALALPLKIIYNFSLNVGIFPNEWKKARIVPVFKKGDRNNVVNYRPISMLSSFAKLFESLVYPLVYRHINASLSDFQHGFRSSRSVESNLVSLVSEIATDIDKGLHIDAIYTDMSNAFDKVNHIKLLSKLEAIGIGNTLLQWFHSYLDERLQAVAVNGCHSQTFIARTGVPQGSHLGPLLFLVFVNDIVAHVKNSKVSMFADDLKIYKTIKNLYDVQVLQKDLDNIVEWCVDNGMILNPSKCVHISFTR
jgi:hypothetical protein